MSILIKGMDMPKSCNECLFNVLSVNEITGEYKRMCFVRKKKIEPLQECPLIEIPTPHGRLIDADKLESHEEFDGYGFTKSVYEDDINDTPTILEAEE